MSQLIFIYGDQVSAAGVLKINKLDRKSLRMQTFFLQNMSSKEIQILIKYF